MSSIENFEICENLKYKFAKRNFLEWDITSLRFTSTLQNHIVEQEKQDKIEDT